MFWFLSVGVSSVDSSVWAQLHVPVGLCVSMCATLLWSVVLQGEKRTLSASSSADSSIINYPPPPCAGMKRALIIIHCLALQALHGGSHSCLVHTLLLSQFSFSLLHHYFSHILLLSPALVQHSALWFLPQCPWSEMQTLGWQHFQNQTTVVFVKITVSLALPAVMTETELLTPHWIKLTLR